MNFLPFEGDSYRDNKTRLLVLGQSHHGEPEEASERGLTSRVINRHLDRSKRLSFFTKVYHVLCIKEDKPERDVFAEIAFYNFVQELLEKSRKDPTTPEWESGIEPFREALLQLDPTHILVLGKATYKWMPRFDGSSRQVAFGPNPTEELGEYKTPSGFALTVGIPHPSSGGFSPQAWAEPVDRFWNGGFAT